MSKGIKFKNKNNEAVYPCPYFPIGSIYMNINNINPEAIFGGKWERVKGKFILGADDEKYKSGNIGGEEKHTLTINEIPSHTHSQKPHYHSGLSYGSPYGGGNTCVVSTTYSSTGCIELGWSRSSTGAPYDNVYTKFSTAENENTGGNYSHNNMPPYLAVYIWKRVS